MSVARCLLQTFPDSASPRLSPAGSVLGLGSSPHMLAAYGWPVVFWAFGSLGMIWCEQEGGLINSEQRLPTSWQSDPGANYKQACPDTVPNLDEEEVQS